jgi:beta-galactosidase
MNMSLFDLLKSMKKIKFILFVISCLFGVNMAYSQQNEWENPVKYEWNKEQPHTDFMIYDRSGDAIKDE